jgi:peroxiredoxin
MRKLKIGDKAPEFTYDTPWGKGLRFSGKGSGKTSVFIFMRYLGCPICQTDIANLKQEIDLIGHGEDNLYVVLQGHAEAMEMLTGKVDWPFAVISDPEGKIFRKFRVNPEGMIKYLHPAGLIAAVRATIQGYRNGRFEGRETQLPAVFIVDRDNTISFAHYGEQLHGAPRKKPAALHP